MYHVKYVILFYKTTKANSVGVAICHGFIICCLLVQTCGLSVF